MMTIHLATQNAHKVEELSGIIKVSDLKVRVSSALDADDISGVRETADTFVGNAKIKANALKNKITENDWVLADDSGLMVDALQGKPGVFSSRYAGANASDTENIHKLLAELKGIDGINRSARFVCVLVLLGPEELEIPLKEFVMDLLQISLEGKVGLAMTLSLYPRGTRKHLDCWMN